VKHAVAREADLRARRQSAIRRWLVTLGSLAALGSTIYSGVKDEPSEKVLIPLGVVSGSSLTAALPGLSQDERAAGLNEKLATIRAEESAAAEQLNLLERALLDRAILLVRQDRLDSESDKWRQLEELQDQKLVEIASAEERLRSKLTSLSNICS
jgi:hypothetical protein